MADNTGLISLECPGGISLDFSSTFYGMLNPLLCESKYMDFLKEFKAPEQKASKKAEKSSAAAARNYASIDNEVSTLQEENIPVDLLFVNFYTQLKNGSERKARNSYKRLINAIIKEALSSISDASLKPSEEKLRASAEELIEKKLGINIEEEFNKCAEKQQIVSKKRAAVRSSKYMTAERRKEAPIAAQRAYAQNTKFIPASAVFKLKQRSISVVEMAETSIFATPQFLGICTLIAWFSIIFCQLQQ